MEISEIQKICTSLDALLDPKVDYARRTEALSICESYKSSPKCAELGFFLAGSSKLSPNAKFYGLQLIKHRIRMHWTTLSAEEQIAMKSLTLTQAASCSRNEPKYIKTAYASIINEIVKHVWPQRWGNMLKEVVDNPSISSDSAYLEIVILFFLALAQDVALYQNVTTKSRARDLRQGLSLSSSYVFEFLVQNLKKEAELIVLSNPSYHNQIVEVCLYTLEAFVEWINVKIVFINNGALFEILFYLFNIEDVRVAATECMLAFVSRKGSIQERQILMKLTEDTIVRKYFAIIQSASTALSFNQSDFQFLFAMGKIIANLANVLISLWENNESNGDFSVSLSSKKIFLEMMFYISSHESKVIAQTVIQCWTNLIRHQTLKEDETLEKLIPLLVDLTTTSLGKKQISKDHFIPFEESCLSDSDELMYLMNLYRCHLIELLRISSTASPNVTMQKCFDYVEKELRQLHLTSADEDELHLTAEKILTFIESVVNNAVYSAEKRNKQMGLPIFRTENLFKSFLQMKTTDLYLLKIYLQCANGLTKMIAHSKDRTSLFHMFVNRLLTVFDEVPCDLSIPAINVLRRQVCSLIVRNSKSYSAIFVDLVEVFKSFILERMNAVPKKLSPFEKTCIFECLILISMEWKDFTQQSQLIADIVSSTTSITSSPAFIEALQDPVKFARAVGLLDVLNDRTEAEQHPSVEMRSNLYYYTALTLGILNRTQVSESFQPNPCSSHLTLAFDHVLALTNLFSLLWSPVMRNAIASDNLKALEMRSCEKRDLICQSSEFLKGPLDEKPKDHWERVQVFLTLCLDNCYLILGLVGKTLGPEFYKVSNLQQIIMQKVLGNVNFLPCLRFKSLLRHFLTPFFKYCPPDKVNDVVSPILQAYCQFLLDRLDPSWEAFGRREYERLQGAENPDDVEEKEEDEILEEQILRTVSREHVELLINIIVNKNPASHKRDKQVKKDENDVDMISSDTSQVNELTVLGAAICASTACEHVLQSSLRALSWYDTTTCQKTIQLLYPLLKQLVLTNVTMFTDDTTRLVLRSLLLGMARHGQHDGCEAHLCSLVLMIIQLLKPHRGQIIFEVLCSTQEGEKISEMQDFLRQFDSFNEKKRKFLFRKLISNIIIRHAGQRFKETPEMHTFPPLPRRKKEMIDNDSNLTTFGLETLFGPSSKIFQQTGTIFS